MNAYIYGGAVIYWLALLIAVYVARKKPRPPRALQERALAFAFGALFFTVFAFLRYNTELGYPWVSVESARHLIALAALLLVAPAGAFVLVYIANGFQDDEP